MHSRLVGMASFILQRMAEQINKSSGLAVELMSVNMLGKLKNWSIHPITWKKPHSLNSTYTSYQNYKWQAFILCYFVSNTTLTCLRNVTFPNKLTKVSELSNETEYFKQLIIFGTLNKSIWYWFVQYSILLTGV